MTGRLAPQFLVALSAVALASACHKRSLNATPAIQHQWQIVSLNGEAFRYVGQPGDYFDFNNGILIESFDNQRDTFSYAVTGDNLSIQSKAGPTPFRITSLTDNQLIIKGLGATPVGNVLDSLRR